LLRLQKDSINGSDRLLLVDDWFETGSQALAAKGLIEEAGGELVGAAIIVDDLPSGVASQFPNFFALLKREDLGPDV
jgi:adenine phosphoribosyltransferase